MEFPVKQLSLKGKNNEIPALGQHYFSSHDGALTTFLTRTYIRWGFRWAEIQRRLRKAEIQGV